MKPDWFPWICWLVLATTVTADVYQYNYEKGIVSFSSKCPGMYCGRRPLGSGNWSACGACPWGWRTNESSCCVPCSDSPQLYDWLFLGFVVLGALVLHWFFIDLLAKQRSFSKDVLALHGCALVEIGLSATATLLLCDPMGTLEVKSCGVGKLADWYPLFFNPQPNYQETLHCTQETVYPLYTMVFIFYAFSIVLLLMLRPFVVRRMKKRHGLSSMYAGLNFLPLLALLQAVGGGLLYFAFPYIVIVLSVVSCAAHFAFRLDQSFTSLVLQTVTDSRNILILFGHWLLHAYGIISVTQLREPQLHFALLSLVPLPTLFYILTARYTEPSKLHVE